MLKNCAKPDRDLTALNDVGRRARVEVKDHRSRTHDVLPERERWMQFDRAQVRHPDQSRQVVTKNVINIALVALAPDGNCLHPIRAMFGGVLFKKRRFVHAIGITLQRERLIF